jgi:transcriptional regulator with XRE-family HTH domain
MTANARARAKAPAPARPRGAAKARAAADTVIGARVAQLRERLGMTLDHLAARTGFTKGYLSKIENSRKVPPIGSLSRIAQALHADITELMHPGTKSAASAFCLVRAGERLPVVRGGTAFGYDYVSLADTKSHKRMEPFLFTFPSQIDKHVYFEHEGEEFIFIVSGRVEWQAGSEKVILEPGDSVYFDSRLPHRGRALDGEASALVVTWRPEQKP